MKLFIILLFFCGENVFAQTTPAWDSTYRPGTYKLQVDNYKSYKNSRKDIVFLGNSITDYAQWNELLQNKHAINRGISGDLTFGILERLKEVTEGHPAKVFILIGINDISRNIPDEVILNNYQRIITQIKNESPRTKIYFNTLLPVNNTFPARNHFNKDEHIAAVNAGLRKICADENITLIDIHDQFTDASGKLGATETFDGLHLNASGYIKWAAILKQYL